MITLATVQDTKRELRTQYNAEAVDDMIIQANRYVADRIDGMFHYDFFPMVASKLFMRSKIVMADYHTHVLNFGEPALEVSEVRGFDGEVKTRWDMTPETLNAAQWRVDPINDELIWGLAWMPYTSTPFGTPSHYNVNVPMTVTGTWGFHKHYGKAWVNSLDTLTADISETDTTLTVEDVTGLRGDRLGPRFEAGNLIRVGAEMMTVLNVESGKMELTVDRGQRGTTAVSHTVGDSLEVYVPDPEMTHAATRWAAYVITRIGQFNQVTLEGIGATIFPKDIPAEVQNILKRYPKRPILV